MLNTRIRDLRKQHGYSQEQLARKLHLTHGAVSQWENGLTVPAADQLAALADIFGISVDEIMGRKAETYANRYAKRGAVLPAPVSPFFCP